MASDFRIGKAYRMPKQRRWRARLSYKNGHGVRKEKQVYWPFGTVGSKGPIESDKQKRIQELRPELERLDTPADALIDYVKNYRDTQIPLMEKKGGVKPATTQTSRHQLNAVIRVLEKPSDGLGQYTFRDFELRCRTFDRDLMESRDKQQKEHGLSYRRHMFYKLSQVFDEAVNDKIITTNPMELLEAPQKPKPRKILFHERKQFVEEFIPRLKKLEWPMFEALVYSYCYAGLRRQEGLSLSGLDIEFTTPETHGFVHVQRSSIDTDSTKGGNSRYVPLSSDFESALKNWKSVAPKTQSDLVFINLDHTPFTKDQARGHLIKLLEESGLSTKEPFHQLRRSFASWLAQNDESPYKLQAWLGHKKLDTTMKYYAGMPTHQLPKGGNLRF